MHWKYTSKPDLTQFGFVYCITNDETGKAYIGCKQYFNYKKGKKKSESNWQTYMGSSKHLLEDIKKNDKEKFKYLGIGKNILSTKVETYDTKVINPKDQIMLTREGDSTQQIDQIFVNDYYENDFNVKYNAFNLILKFMTNSN